MMGWDKLDLARPHPNPLPRGEGTRCECFWFIGRRSNLSRRRYFQNVPRLNYSILRNIIAVDFSRPRDQSVIPVPSPRQRSAGRGLGRGETQNEELRM